MGRPGLLLFRRVGGLKLLKCLYFIQFKAAFNHVIHATWRCLMQLLVILSFIREVICLILSPSDFTNLTRELEIHELLHIRWLSKLSAGKGAPN